MASTSGAHACTSELPSLRLEIAAYKRERAEVVAQIQSLEQQRTHESREQLKRLQHKEQSLLDLMKELQHKENLLLGSSAGAAAGNLEKTVDALTAQLSQLASASGRIISEAALNLLEGSVFLVLSQKSECGASTSSGEGGSIDGRACDGVGVCVSAQRAVTAAHNLVGLAAGDNVKVYFPEARAKLQLQVEVIEKELDFAVLTTPNNFSKHLPLYKGLSRSLVGQHMALCALQLGIHEELPEWSVSSVGVMPATCVKLSRHAHHLLYASDTWPGDSGGALVLYNGELVGLHLMGVNALKEQLEHRRSLNERVDAVEESLESAARSMASGCIALLAHVFADRLGV